MTSGVFRLVLAAIVCLGAAVATAWAFQVPALQEPDELAHLDYAFALYDVGRPFVVRNAEPGTEVTRQATYLAAVSNYRVMRYNPVAREPNAYGTAAFWKRVDAAAPRPSHRAPPTGSRMPYVMFAYPIGYYVLLATIMSLADWISHGSFTAVFFAARLMNVACLVATLVLASTVFRRVGLDRVTALYATAAVAVFPLASWVAGYVQPDNLALLLLTAIVYVALRWTVNPFSTRLSICLSVLLGAIFLTKLQYAIAAWLVIAFLTVSRVNRAVEPARVAACVFTLVPAPIILYAASFDFLPVSQQSLGQLLRVPRSAGAVDSLGFIMKAGSAVLSGLIDAYGGGFAFVGYWYFFGFRSGLIFSKPLVTVMQYVLIVATMATLTLFLANAFHTLRRIAYVARFRSCARALRFIAVDVAVNLYLTVTILLLAARGATEGWLQLEGRYWLPVVVPAILLVVVRVPKLVRHLNHRRLIARWLATGLAGYSLFAAVAAFGAMRANFYGFRKATTRQDPFARVEKIQGTGQRSQDPQGAIVLRNDRAIAISGYAIDMQSGFPAGAVALVIDGTQRYRAKTHLLSAEISGLLHDDKVRNSGFALRLPARTMVPGSHRLTFEIARASSGSPFEIGDPLSVLIVPGDARV